MSAKTAKILVTIDEDARADAVPRVRDLLKEAGAENAVILKERPTGIIEVWVPGDPRPLVQRLNDLYERDAARFRGTHRWMPVESWARADPRDLEAYAELFRRSLKDDESWKVEVRKHQAEVSSHDLIENITKLIDQPNVDLEEPDRTLFVNVLGDRLGFADVHRDELFEAPPTTGKAAQRA